MTETQYFDNVKSYKLLANKSLGQNFLINPEVAKNIVNLLELSDKDEVIEIGSGLGSLSYFLTKIPAKTQLIDIDVRMLQFLNEQFGNIKNVVVRRQNILKEDLAKYTKIIGNLPYYITSSIIEHILLTAVNAEKIVLMTQKEVYPKLLSNFKSPLSLFLNYVAVISSAKEVGRNNFAPIPHVDSVVFTLTPNKNIKNEENKKLLKLMQQLFLLRRKNILNNLANVTKNKDKAKEILAKLGVDTNKRPEELDINFYISLLKELNF
ncbi:MAG: 16S rRNA (adenine(1518)-N(6)/adenine(1519)-N(6))-dimethyltransferase RsmA [Bacilli bacterium]|nr:16S rRNA (adenine(1518)-N(6)/adenine(1519)-N(6))-dimethyltransferase RsmA [Bacilli bacterium]